ncbi:MAG: DUF177 domain-containing protein [Firmicutes bacterium]|nr:DUF177 domain-containing protein [Bacillota bacterium]
MFLDLASLRRQGGKQQYRFEEALPALKTEYEDVGFVEPLTVEVEAVNTGNVILVDLAASSTVRLECSCCLAPIEYPLHLKLNLAFVHQDDLAELGIENDLEADDEEYYQVYKDQPFDIGELVAEHLLVSLPMKPVCREDCKGLCSMCGKDLNLGACGCEETTIDPRMEVLRGLLGSSD